MFYFLLGLLFINVILSFLKILPFSSSDILFGGLYLTFICNLANFILSKLFHVKTNPESSYITAFILALIIGPLPFFENTFTLTLIGIFAMASKYILVVKKKHIFNPAAVAVLIGAFTIKTGASWWVGNNFLLPFLIIGGFFIASKIKRLELVASFLAVYFLGVLITQQFTLSALTNPSIWFFALVMIIEPLTSPSTKKLQIFFGALIAFIYLFLSKIIPTYGFGLESSLLIGNLLTLATSPSFNILLEFRKKEKVANNTWSLFFEPIRKLNFTPGQFLEWTYPHKNADSRGIRRHFTISTSPNEKYITVTMKIAEKGSSFKTAILNMRNGEQISAVGPGGGFVLPEDRNLPLCFITGGIGVTPFRSMVKYLLENNESRNIVMLYSNNTLEDVAFKDVFAEAERIGIKTNFIITKRDGHIDEKMIKEKVPDYKDRDFYISGPEPMVKAFKRMLSGMEVRKIKTDYFPGYTETYQK